MGRETRDRTQNWVGRKGSGYGRNWVRGKYALKTHKILKEPIIINKKIVCGVFRVEDHLGAVLRVPLTSLELTMRARLAGR